MPVKSDNACYGQNQDTKSYHYLEDLRIIASGSMYLSKELNTDHLTVSIAGSGSFLAPSLECSQKLSIQVIGSGDISCSKLQTEQCDINIAGSGNIRVSDIQAEKLTGAVAGSGDLHLQGKARKAEYHQAGSGTIHAEEYAAQDVIAQCIGNGEIYCLSLIHI